jgi:hypothetical protein
LPDSDRHLNLSKGSCMNGLFSEIRIFTPTISGLLLRYPIFLNDIRLTALACQKEQVPVEVITQDPRPEKVCLIVGSRRLATGSA